MSKLDEAEAALEQRLTRDDVVDTKPRKVTLVQSVRLSKDTTLRLLKEAERRGVTPSRVIRDYVEAGLDATDEAATVNIADVHRAIDSLGRRTA